jgi:hypothetical protein
MMALRYLITSWPVLLSHGHYSYQPISREEALSWFLEHHKTVRIGGFNPGQPPTHITNQARFDLVTLMAKAVDRYVENQQHNIGELTEVDEVLVVHGPPPRGNQPVLLDQLSFAFFKREKEQHRVHHSEHEHQKERETVNA